MKKNRKPKPGDIVLVRWIDSCSPTSGKWLSKEGADRFSPVECVSVGQIGRYDAAALLVFASWSPDEVGEVTAIPAVCVQSVEVLRRKEKM